MQALNAKNRENGTIEEDLPSVSDSDEYAGAGDGSADFTVVKRKGAKSVVREYQKIEGALYDHPMYYDWAFGFRTYETEVSAQLNMLRPNTCLDHPENCLSTVYKSPSVQLRLLN